MKSFSYRAYLLNIIFSGCCFWIIRNAIAGQNLFFLYSILWKRRAFFSLPLAWKGLEERRWRGAKDSFEFSKTKLIIRESFFFFFRPVFQTFSWNLYFFFKRKNVFNSRSTDPRPTLMSSFGYKGVRKRIHFRNSYQMQAFKKKKKIRIRIGLAYRLSVRLKRSNFSDRPFFFFYSFSFFVSWRLFRPLV